MASMAQGLGVTSMVKVMGEVSEAEGEASAETAEGERGRGRERMWQRLGRSEP